VSNRLSHLEVAMDTTVATRATVHSVACDRCGARGFVRYQLPSGRELILCGHHGREHGPALIAGNATATIA
jgi:hypothetical protein